MPHHILRLPSVKAVTGLSRSTLYNRIAEGRFPAPIALGGRAVGWLESEVQMWLEDRIQESRKTEASCHPHSSLTTRSCVEGMEKLTGGRQL